MKPDLYRSFMVILLGGILIFPEQISGAPGPSLDSSESTNSATIFSESGDAASPVSDLFDFFKKTQKDFLTTSGQESYNTKLDTLRTQTVELKIALRNAFPTLSEQEKAVASAIQMNLEKLDFAILAREEIEEIKEILKSIEKSFKEF